MAVRPNDRYATEKPDAEKEPKVTAPKITATEVYDRFRELGLYETIDKRDFALININPQYGMELLDAKLEYNDPVTSEERKAEIAADFETRRTNEYASRKVGPKVAGNGAFTANGGNNNWQSLLESMLASYASDKFSYDANSDPRYELAKEYAVNAMKNQMAESATLSGGYGNSYASAAGQGVYTDYMDKAAASLEADAYNRWQNEKADKLNMISMVSALEERDYNRAYQKERDAKADARYDAQWTNTLERQDVEDERYDTQQASDDEQKARDHVKNYIIMNGSAEGLTDEEIAATGWSPEYIAAIEAAAQRQSDYNAPDIDLKTAIALKESGYSSPEIEAALRYYLGEGYTYSPPVVSTGGGYRSSGGKADADEDEYNNQFSKTDYFLDLDGWIPKDVTDSSDVERFLISSGMKEGQAEALASEYINYRTDVNLYVSQVKNMEPDTAIRFIHTMIADNSRDEYYITVLTAVLYECGLFNKYTATYGSL